MSTLKVNNIKTYDIGDNDFPLTLHNRTQMTGSEAKGNHSFAVGLGTIASGSKQVVLGKYNIVDNSTNTVLVIGNGTGPSDRKNLAKFTTSQIIFDSGSIPTSDPGVQGQLYRTGSNFDELRISL